MMSTGGKEKQGYKLPGLQTMSWSTLLQTAKLSWLFLWLCRETHVSEGYPTDLLGYWKMPAALLRGSHWSLCSSLSTKETRSETWFRWNRWGESMLSLCEEHQALGRAENPASGAGPLSSGPAQLLHAAQVPGGAGRGWKLAFVSSSCEMVELALHVRESILKPAPGRCSNHDSLCTTCTAGRPLGRRGSAPTPTASPLAVQQFTLE